MTELKDLRFAAPTAFALMLLLPTMAVRGGLLSFDYRFEALMLVSLLVIGACALAGFTAAELGVAFPSRRNHWIVSVSVTAALVAFVALEAQFVSTHRSAPDFASFAPFYLLVSCPLQEIVCRAIPKLIADRLQAGHVKYILFSATTFSLMHAAYDDRLLLLNTFFAGLAWAAAYLVTRNIWPLAFSHAAVGLYAFSLGVA